MKKKLLFLLLPALLLFSCKQKTVKTIEKNFSQTEYLSADTAKGGIKVNIDVEIPVCYHGKTVLSAIQQDIFEALFGEQYALLSVDSVIPAFVADLIAEYHQNNEPMLHEIDSLPQNEHDYFFLNNSFELSGFSLLTYVNQRIYSYGITTDAYTGGAYNNYSTVYLNYNLTDGQRITENVLFCENFTDTLAALIKQCLMEQSLTNSDIPDIVNWDDSDYWENEIKPNGNFYLNEDGINYLFNPYEIAPFSVGTTEITVPYSKIRDLLKEEYSFLIKL